MRNDWTECSFGDLLNYEQPTKYIVKSTKYNDSYKTPVLTAGKSFIKGYTNETDGVFTNFPTIIFDDFTTASQFVNFEFKVKSSAMKILIPTSKLVNIKFIFYGMQVNKIRNDTHKRYWISVFSKKKFFLPPLPEQRAIVKKIETLFSDLDNGIADLKKAAGQLKIYRQAVLKKAFEGELTKEWREQRTLRLSKGTEKEKHFEIVASRASATSKEPSPEALEGRTYEITKTKQYGASRTSAPGENLPTAEELLKQIKTERESYYQNQLDEWKEAVKEWEAKGKEGKKPSRIAKPKKMTGIKKADVLDYGNIPTIWMWTRFGNVTYKIGDIDHKMPKTVDEGLPYLSTGNLKKDGTIDFLNAKTISKADFDRLSLKIKPERGDIIFPRYGTIGRNILIEFDKDFLVSYSCAIIKNITKLMSGKFVFYYSLSPVIKKEIKKYTVETTQANIGISSIANFVFPLCSLPEQTQIVHEIESRLSVCDQVEADIAENLQKAEALRQSILKKAFEGKLLTEAELESCRKEPDWEPAENLLERIKGEKKNGK